MTERRKSVRKAIRMACAVQFSSGFTLYGNTKDLSLDGVSIESNSLTDTTQQSVTPGENALLTLKFKHGAIADSIMLKCQVMHLLANTIGLSIRFSELNKIEQGILSQILVSGKPEILSD